MKEFILKKRSILFHIILAILTYGIWLLIYFICKISNKKNEETIITFEQTTPEKNIETKVVENIRTVTIYVAGCFNYQKDIQSIKNNILEYDCEEKYNGMTNKEIIEDGQDIWEYDPLLVGEVKLIKEPNNKYDKNAIRVEIENKLVGYIPKKNILLFNNLENVKSISGFIYGGNLKKIDYDTEEYKDKVIIEKHELGIQLEVIFKQ